MPIEINDLIIHSNVLVLHGFAPTGANDVDERGYPIVRSIDYRFNNINNNMNVEDFFLSCLTFNLGVDRPFSYIPMGQVNGHLFRNTGVVLSCGTLTHAYYDDMGITITTPMNSINRHQIPNIETFINKGIIDHSNYPPTTPHAANPVENGHNELRVTNANIIGFYYFSTDDSGFSKEVMINASMNFNIPLFDFSRNNLNAIEIYENNIISWEEFIHEYIER